MNKHMNKKILDFNSKYFKYKLYLFLVEKIYFNFNTEEIIFFN